MIFVNFSKPVYNEDNNVLQMSLVQAFLKNL